MKQENLDLIYLCGCMVNDRKPDKKRVEAMDLEAVHALAKKQTLSAITYYAVEDIIDNSTELSKTWKQEREMAIRKNISFDFERNKIFAELEKNGIKHIALKGAVLKDMYSKLGMRQMSDNDVLFDKKYQKKVYDIFIENGYYCDKFDRTNHDTYMKEPFYNFEMHTSLLNTLQKLSFYYQDIWEKLKLLDGKKYEYYFTDEDFYIFMVVHAHKHFISRGTGLRTLLDFYVYNKAKRKTLDYEYISNECKKMKLCSFEKMMRVLSWKIFSKPSEFNYESLQPKSKEILQTFFTAGTYGTFEQKVYNYFNKSGVDYKHFTKLEKLKYILYRAFPDINFMKMWCNKYFRFALKYPILLPLAYLYRFIFITIISPKNAKLEIKILNKK